MNQANLFNIILSPHVSEKTATGAEKRNEYVFHVASTATKPQVKDAVELLFKTKVKTVRTSVVKAKKKIFKGIEGKKKGWKKAYVTLQADQKLDMMVAE